MPVQKAKASYFSTQSGRTAYLQHKDDETKEVDGGRLPAGIEGGIAQLRGISTSGEYKKGKLKGKPFFRAYGVVIQPEFHNGIRVKGKQTSVMIPLCDTGEGKRLVTEDQHVGEMLQVIKRLGLDTSKIPDKQIDAAIEALVKSRPMFEFRTWKGTELKSKQQGGHYYVVNPDGSNAGGPYKTEAEMKKAYPYVDRDSMVNEVWLSAVKYDANGQAVDTGVEDETAEVDENKLPTPDEETEDENAGEDEEGQEDEAEGDEEAADDEAVDFDALGEVADTEDDPGQQDAINQLNQMGKDAGLTEKQINAYATWSELAEYLKSLGGDEGTEGEGEEAWKPVVGEIYPLKLMDPKTKTKPAKPVNYIVKSVNEDQETVTVVPQKNPKDKPRSVNWAALPHDE